MNATRSAIVEHSRRDQTFFFRHSLFGRKRSKMAIEFDCPACDATIRVKDNAAGKKGRCPKCKVLLLVPEPEDDVVDDEPTEVTGPEDTPVQIPTQEKPLADAMPALPTPQELVPPSTEFTSPRQALADTPLETPILEVPSAREATPAAAETLLPRDRQEPAAKETAAAFDPVDPFGFPIVTDRPASAVKVPVRRTASRRKTGGLLSMVVAVLAFATVGAVGWWLYQSTRPRVPDQVIGERFATVTLRPLQFAAPVASAVPQADLDAVKADLAKQGLPLKSDFISVWLEMNGDELQVTVSPGPQSAPIRVDLGALPGVRALLSRERDRIAAVQQRELRKSTAAFFQDFAAFLKDGTPMTRLPNYRDDVALNASVGVTGYAVEAVVGSTPFPCAYEDTTGGCYFFPPAATQKFRLRGRKLADGTTPLPVDLEVIVQEGRMSPITDDGTQEAETESPVDDSEQETASESEETSEDTGTPATTDSTTNADGE